MMKPISDKKDVDGKKEENTETKKSGKPKKKKNSYKKETINDDEEHSEDGNNDIPDQPELPQKVDKTKKKKPTSKTNETKGAEEEEDDDFYKCNVCEKVFTTNEKYKEHKKKCTKVPKKHVCSKCSKGFTSRTYLVQHYDYHHTNKPKQFRCETCNTDFELEKSFKEHNRRLHNPGDYKYMCDFCSRKFWHRQEFTLHRAHHTGNKPFHCGICKLASFADPHRLTHHLKTCSKENSYKCNQCGGMYSDQKSLSTHVSDHHDKTKQKCPICPNKVYTSEGGYYNHMRNAHQIGCRGQKLKDVLQNNEEKKSSEEENNGDISDGSDEEESKKKNRNRSLQMEPHQKVMMNNKKTKTN